MPVDDYGFYFWWKPAEPPELSRAKMAEKKLRNKTKKRKSDEKHNTRNKRLL